MVADHTVIPAAFDAGINFFFVTADYHWPQYEAARRGLRDLIARRRGIREEIVVAAVSYVTQSDFYGASFADLLSATPELRYLDVVIAGGVADREVQRRLPAYRRLQSFDVGSPEAPAVGATFHSRPWCTRAIAANWLDIAFIRYNPPYARKVDREVLSPSHQRSALVYAFGSTAGFLHPADLDRLRVPAGCWRPSVPDYYRFALGHPGLDGLLCSPGSPAEVTQLTEALEKGPLENLAVAYLLDLGELALGTARVVTSEHTAAGEDDGGR